MSNWNYNSSTFQNVDYQMSRFTPTVQNSNGDVVIDIFNFNIRKAIDAITIADSSSYIADQKLPVLSYKYCGTTSAYWMIGIASGAMHPYRLSGGDHILYPNIERMTNVIGSNSSTNVQSTTQDVVI